MTPTQTIECCALDCHRPAEWTIYWGVGLDEYTYACPDHVTELLVPDRSNTLYPLPIEIKENQK